MRTKTKTGWSALRTIIIIVIMIIVFDLFGAKYGILVFLGLILAIGFFFGYKYRYEINEMFNAQKEMTRMGNEARRKLKELEKKKND